MVKQRTVFCCSECGGESVKWYGRCPHCGAWNTLTEEKVIDSKAVNPGQLRMAESKPLPLPQIRVDAVARWVLGMGELDEVLGGGLTPGSSILLGGEPGIGKSTLLLQAAAAMSAHGRTLYISGEESAEQIRLRAERLSALSPQVYLLAQTDINAALAQARALDISLLIVDSVQAVYSPDLVSAPGSVSQVRAVAAACLALAREKGCAVMLIGHVTKEGMLAGPRVLEHMVDTVLYFEGERHTSLRLLRAVKNRFGSTNELGVFEMGAQGLASLAAPSAYFIGERRANSPGSAVTCVLQGNRPLLIEVQSLVSKSTFGNPRRLATGYDYNRLLLIIAVLERKLGLILGDKDVYLNIAGGGKAEDTAADLAVAAAIASSLKDQALPGNILLLGEVGLLGEIRTISNADKRCREGIGFGFSSVLLPTGVGLSLNGVKPLYVDNLREALMILDLA